MVKHVIFTIILALLLVSILTSLTSSQEGFQPFTLKAFLDKLSNVPEVRFSLADSFDEWNASLKWEMNLKFWNPMGLADINDYFYVPIKLDLLKSIWDFVLAPVIRLVVFVLDFLVQLMVLLYYVFSITFIT